MTRKRIKQQLPGFPWESNPTAAAAGPWPSDPTVVYDYILSITSYVLLRRVRV